MERFFEDDVVNSAMSQIYLVLKRDYRTLSPRDYVNMGKTQCVISGLILMLFIKDIYGSK